MRIFSYDQLKDMAQLEQISGNKLPIQNSKGVILKPPIRKWESPETYTKCKSMGAAHAALNPQVYHTPTYLRVGSFQGPLAQGKLRLAR